MIKGIADVGLRLAVDADAAEIARLTRQLGYPATAADTATRLPHMLALSHHFICVAAGVGDRLHGWIAAEDRLLLEYGRRVELTGLVVDAEVRRSGIGHALVAAAERWAHERGVDRITVRSNVVRVEAHLFYECLGYVRHKTQHSYDKRL